MVVQIFRATVYFPIPLGSKLSKTKVYIKQVKIHMTLWPTKLPLKWVYNYEKNKREMSIR